MPKGQKTLMKARNFTASLKPMWDAKRIQDFLETMQGVAKVYVANHDKDQNDQGELVEGHTHVFLLYETPRSVQGVARVFGVQPNFVEVVRNRVAMFRYLTHMDDPKKHRYDPSEVKTNAEPYDQVIQGATMTDREIIEKCQRGEELDLIGVVSMQKIAMAQRLITNRAIHRANETIAILRDQNTLLMANVDKLLGHVSTIEANFTQLVQGLTEGGAKLAESLQKSANTIAEQLKLARVGLKSRR